MPEQVRRKLASIGSVLMLLLAIATGFGDIPTVLSKLISLGGEHWISLVFALAAFVLWAVPNWDSVERWFGIQSNRAVREKVRRMLEEMRYSVEKTETDTTVHWGWGAELKTDDGTTGNRIIDHAFTVMRTKALPEALTFGVRMELPDPVRKGIAGLTPPARSRAYAAVQLEIAASGAHYRLLDQDGKPLARLAGFDAVHEILLSEVVFIADGLTKEEFLNGIDRLRTAVVVAGQALSRELNASGTTITLMKPIAAPKNRATRRASGANPR